MKESRLTVVVRAIGWTKELIWSSRTVRREFIISVPLRSYCVQQSPSSHRRTILGAHCSSKHAVRFLRRRRPAREIQRKGVNLMSYREMAWRKSCSCNALAMRVRIGQSTREKNPNFQKITIKGALWWKIELEKLYQKERERMRGCW